MSYFLAPSLADLRSEVNGKYPNRDKASDGWIGDPSHSARKSEHNPWWGAPGKWSGVVQAIDIDNNGRPGERTPLVRDVLKATIGDPRVWYVIWNGRIYSRTYGWRARIYTGSNKHDHHVHVSLRESVAAWSNTARWLDGSATKTKPGKINVTQVREQFLIAAGAERGDITSLLGVKRIQKLLNGRGEHLTVDGFVGPATLNAWGRWEKSVGYRGRPRVPDRHSLAPLVKGRFRLFNLPKGW